MQQSTRWLVLQGCKPLPDKFYAMFSWVCPGLLATRASSVRAVPSLFSALLLPPCPQCLYPLNTLSPLVPKPHPQSP
eukprot:2669196-Rhodomonas_salina.2